MEAPKLTRRERKRLEARERIVESAEHLFEMQGYEATTVNEIAERADIGYGTFFQHFPTKLDVLRVISEKKLRKLFVDVEEIRKQPGTFSDHLVELFAGSAERTLEMGPKTRELLSAMMTQAMPETAEQDDLRIRTAFRAFLEDGLASGELRTDTDPEVLIEVVIGTWTSLFLSWVHIDDYPLCERAAKAARFLASTLTPQPAASLEA